MLRVFGRGFQASSGEAPGLFFFFFGDIIEHFTRKKNMMIFSQLYPFAIRRVKLNMMGSEFFCYYSTKNFRHFVIGYSFLAAMKRR